MCVCVSVCVYACVYACLYVCISDVYFTILILFKSELKCYTTIQYHNSVFKPVPHVLNPSKACVKPVPLYIMLRHTSRACQRVGDKSWMLLAAAGVWG